MVNVILLKNTQLMFTVAMTMDVYQDGDLSNEQNILRDSGTTKLFVVPMASSG